MYTWRFCFCIHYFMYSKFKNAWFFNNHKTRINMEIETTSLEPWNSYPRRVIRRRHKINSNTKRTSRSQPITLLVQPFKHIYLRVRGDWKKRKKNETGTRIPLAESNGRKTTTRSLKTIKTEHTKTPIRLPHHDQKPLLLAFLLPPLFTFYTWRKIKKTK